MASGFRRAGLERAPPDFPRRLHVRRRAGEKVQHRPDGREGIGVGAPRRARAGLGRRQDVVEVVLVNAAVVIPALRPAERALHAVAVAAEFGDESVKVFAAVTHERPAFVEREASPGGADGGRVADAAPDKPGGGGELGEPDGVADLARPDAGQMGAAPAIQHSAPPGVRLLHSEGDLAYARPPVPKIDDLPADALQFLPGARAHLRQPRLGCVVHAASPLISITMYCISMRGATRSKEDGDEMKLLTKGSRDRMILNGQRAKRVDGTNDEIDFQPVVKLFNPVGPGIWLLSELNPEDPDIAYGLADIGMHCVELGYVRISELEGIRLPFGLCIERCRGWKPETTLAGYYRRARKAGRIVA